MKRNLITVMPEKNTISTFSGWFVTISDNAIRIDGLGKLPSSAYVEELNPHYHLLHAASLKKKIVKRTTEIREEDGTWAGEKACTFTKIKLRPEPDEKVYYRIFLDNTQSLSNAFNILLDTHVEDPIEEGKFTRIVYASLPKNLPLILDSKGTLCVSPL